jgi:hypothetical protein
VSCNQRIIENMTGSGINVTVPQRDSVSFNHFSVSWSSGSLSSGATNLTVESIESMKVVQVPGQKDSDGKDVWETLVNKTVLDCHPTLAQLVLNISYVEGIRYITYVKENVQIFNPDLDFDILYPAQNDQTRIGNSTYDLWTAKVKEIARMWNIWAILDAALLAFEFKCEGSVNIIGNGYFGDLELSLFNPCQDKGQLQIVAFR